MPADPTKHPLVDSVKEWGGRSDSKGHTFADQYAAVVAKILKDGPQDPADAFLSFTLAHNPDEVVTLKDVSAQRSEQRSKRLEADLAAYKERDEAFKASEVKRKAREAAEAAGEEYVSESEAKEGEEGEEAAPAEGEEPAEPVAPPAPPAFARGLTEVENAELARAKAVLKLIEKAEPKLDEEGNPVEPEEGEAVDAGPTNEEFLIPDVMDDANLFQSAGVGFTMEESYKLTLALKYLAERNPLQYVRLFGKILGTERDYYVAESEFKEGEGRPEAAEGDEPPAEDGEVDPKNWKPRAEPMGEGINKLTYWVCSYPGGPWSRLPDLTPEMVSVSRQIRKYFSGNLEAKVYSYPALDWTEKHLLRAQIARIAASTYIVPDQYFITEEQEEAFTEAEGEVAEEPGPFGLKKVSKAPASWKEVGVDKPEGWVHYHPMILGLQNVCKYQKPPKEKVEGEEEEEEEDPDAPVPVPAEEGHRNILAKINGDNHLVEGMNIYPRRKINSWTLKSHFNNVVSVSSNHWPGAIAVARGSKRYANLYIGWGLKAQRGAFTMAMPPDLMTEYVHGEGEGELVEEVDPTHADEMFKIEEAERLAAAAAGGEGEE